MALPSLPGTGLARLGAAIGDRTRRRGLGSSLDKLRYANAYIYGRATAQSAERVLYVGVGHGHDAVLALLEGGARSVVGVDPYWGAHGNDDLDFDAVGNLISSLSLETRFVAERMTIQDYLAEHDDTFDLIICNDVLHHIFVTTDALSRSAELDAAVELFAGLRGLLRRGGKLIVVDVGRFGLRQMLARMGIGGGNVDYTTKQSWLQWAGAAARAGWTCTATTNYVPYALRRLEPLLQGRIGRLLACDRYFLKLQPTELV